MKEEKNIFPFSGNNIRREQNIIIKDHNHNKAGFEIELAVLKRLDGLQIPKLIKSNDSNVLHLEYIHGINGRTAIENGYVKELLFEMGKFLTLLHKADSTKLKGVIPGNGSVLCHGDFAHYNSVVSDNSSELLAIVDWEASFLGDSITDIAWCEFQFLRQFPNHKWAVRYLFDGFGQTPDSTKREKAVQERLFYLNKNFRNG